MEVISEELQKKIDKFNQWGRPGARAKITIGGGTYFCDIKGTPRVEPQPPNGVLDVVVAIADLVNISGRAMVLTQFKSVLVDKLKPV